MMFPLCADFGDAAVLLEEWLIELIRERFGEARVANAMQYRKGPIGANDAVIVYMCVR